MFGLPGATGTLLVLLTQTVRGPGGRVINSYYEGLGFRLLPHNRLEQWPYGQLYVLMIHLRTILKVDVRYTRTSPKLRSSPTSLCSLGDSCRKLCLTGAYRRVGEVYVVFVILEANFAFLVRKGVGEWILITMPIHL